MKNRLRAISISISILISLCIIQSSIFAQNPGRIIDIKVFVPVQNSSGAINLVFKGSGFEPESMVQLGYSFGVLSEGEKEDLFEVSADKNGEFLVHTFFSTGYDEYLGFSLDYFIPQGVYFTEQFVEDVNFRIGADKDSGTITIDNPIHNSSCNYDLSIYTFELIDNSSWSLGVDQIVYVEDIPILGNEDIILEGLYSQGHILLIVTPNKCNDSKWGGIDTSLDSFLILGPRVEFEWMGSGVLFEGTFIPIQGVFEDEVQIGDIVTGYVFWDDEGNPTSAWVVSK